MFVKCAEKTELPGYGFLRHAKPASWGGENGSRRGKTDPEGSKVGDLLYTGMVPDAKTEIPDKDGQHRHTHQSEKRSILERHT